MNDGPYRTAPPQPPPPPWWERIHWPSVVLFVGIVACAAATPIAFFMLVPERIIDKLFNLPWTTILGVGAPAVAAAIGVVRQAITAPLLRPVPPATVEAPKPAEGGTEDRP